MIHPFSFPGAFYSLVPVRGGRKRNKVRARMAKLSRRRNRK